MPEVFLREGGTELVLLVTIQRTDIDFTPIHSQCIPGTL